MTTSHSSGCSAHNYDNNEIHNIENSREALPSQVFQVVGKRNQRAKGCKGHYLDQTHTSPKGTVPLGRGKVRTLPTKIYF